MRNRKTVRLLGVPLLEKYTARFEALIAARKADASAAKAFHALERASRYGRSEAVATALHIVRVLLNSLKLRLGASPDSGLQPTALQISRAISELTEPSCDTARRAKLAQYLNLAFQHLIVRCDQEQARHVEFLRHVRRIEALLDELDEKSAKDRGFDHYGRHYP